MGIIILFYKYVALKNPHTIMQWQKELCTDLGLKGRIVIAHEGINGTLGGTTESIEHYLNCMHEYPLFNDIDFKTSSGDAACFPRLYITVKNEIVHSGLDPTLSSTSNGTYLTPEQAHELIKQKPDNLVILDARNRYESKIGKFTNAITPTIENFRELPAYIDAHVDTFKNKQVLMYCTGGIRCERASAYLKSKNIAQNVYQLRGGIHRYVEHYPDGFFRGKNYVFDNRIAVKVNDDILSTCQQCNTLCDDYQNCINATCNNHFICCTACFELFAHTCSTICKELITTKHVNQRPPFEKYEP